MMRLNKYIAQSGYCSRRKADELISEGKVEVNGKISKELGAQINPQKDKITIQGNTLKIPKQFTYLLLNKPSGYTTTRSDPFAEKTIFDLLPKQFHNLHPVGRLDKDTEGLLLLTDDGEFTYQMTHPSRACEKTYEVDVQKKIPSQIVEKLEKGIQIEEEKKGEMTFYQTQPCRIKSLKKDSESHYEVIISEGRKRQIRKMFQSIGHPVLYLKRVAMGTYKLGDLKPGKWQRIEKQ